MDRARPGLAVLLSAISAAMWCTIADTWIHVHPVHQLEMVALGIVALWMGLLTCDLVRAGLLRRRLDLQSSPTVIDGVALRVIQGGAVEAFVLGALRPTVYVGEAAMSILDPIELVAVAHHEEHHRRTHAPLRAAAVEAWLRMVGRSAHARRLLDARLAELEASADAHAIRQGVSPARIAGALVKFDAGHSATPAFAAARDHRIRVLLDTAAGRPSTRTTPLPYEWLLLMVALAMTIGCRLHELPH